LALSRTFLVAFEISKGREPINADLFRQPVACLQEERLACVFVAHPTREALTFTINGGRSRILLDHNRG
jgi:hypothetical protein